jgi:hypothetical protein
MSQSIKKCSIFGCESSQVVGDDNLAYRETDDTLYICSGCMAIAVVFCRDKTVETSTNDNVLLPLDEDSTDIFRRDGDDGVWEW